MSVRLQDYREVPVPAEGPYDAVASIEMSEHVGQEQYPAYAATLHRLVRPGGRVLLQAMSHPSAPGGGAFIERYVAPDMHMRPVWETAAMLARPGLELRDVREHPRALRVDRARLGRHPRAALGRGGRPDRARRARGSGGSTWPAAA